MDWIIITLRDQICGLDPELRELTSPDLFVDHRM
jgi:hypothetical protein